MPFAMDRRRCPRCGVVVQSWWWPLKDQLTCAICGLHRNGHPVAGQDSSAIIGAPSDAKALPAQGDPR